MIILNIDNLLNDITFRSYEKTFQQVIQVSGRAGRKKLQGEVFIQTFQPNHQVIKLCKSQNVKNFIQWEIESRKKKPTTSIQELHFTNFDFETRKRVDIVFQNYFRKN